MRVSNITAQVVSTSLFMLVLFTAFSATAFAATLRLTPETGVYTAGNTFNAQVVVNTAGKAVNASEGQLTFNPRELSVVSVTRGNSIFNLCPQEPTFSNSTGVISYGCGSTVPSGYTGSSGNVLSITFRALAAGTAKVVFSNGMITAADGLGTNVLTAMTGASYTINAQTSAPPPEYVPPANTPAAPEITSSSHPDPAKWYKDTTAKLSWTLPSDIIAVRLLLDSKSGTIPTNTYEERLTSRTIEDLPQGISYFHIQFKNKDGWGRVTHYRLAVDSEEPSKFSITEKELAANDPARTLLFDIEDTSPIAEYRIRIDGGEAVILKGDEATTTYQLPRLGAGEHTVIVEAVDSAGNTRVATYSFTINAFEAPVFSQYPERLNTGVVPAISGTTRPDASVTITVSYDGKEELFTTTSDATGGFIFVPNDSFEPGVYEITARATDAFGAESANSLPIRIIVEEPGYLRVGSYLISVLSVIVPLVALIFVLVVSTWYFWYRFAAWRRKLRKETREVDERMTIELDEIITNLNIKVTELQASRKSKLTKAEQALIDQILVDVSDARAKIRKEITDIEKIIKP